MLKGWGIISLIVSGYCFVKGLFMGLGSYMSTTGGQGGCFMYFLGGIVLLVLGVGILIFNHCVNNCG